MGTFTRINHEGIIHREPKTRFKTALFQIFTGCVLATVLLLSCKKKTNEDTSPVVNPTDPPAISILGDLCQDTLVTSGYFGVVVDVKKLSYCQLEVKVDGKVKYTQVNSHGYFNINVAEFNIGYGLYPTDLVVSYRGYSGSTGGSQSTGTQQTIKRITLIYIPDLQSFNPNVSFSQQQGTLLGTFYSTPTSPGIDRIKIEKSVGTTDQFFYLKTVDGKSPFNFNDSTYVGEQATYRITTYKKINQVNYFYPVNTGTVGKDREPMPVSKIIDSKGFPVLSWQKTNYPANCGGYNIVNTYAGVRVVAGTLNNLDQTSFTPTDIAYPGINKFYVSFIPKSPPPYYSLDLAIQEYSGSDTATAGIPSIKFDYFYSPAGTDFYTRYNKVITGYDVSTLQVTCQFAAPQELYSMSVSPNNKYLLAFEYENGYRYLLYHIPTKTLSYVGANEVDPRLDIMESISISDNGIAVVGSYFGDVYVYDFVNHLKIGSVPYFTDPRTEMSCDGKYFFISDGSLHLYGIDKGIITEKWHSATYEESYTWYSFLPGDGSKALVIQNKMLSVKNCLDWSPDRSFAVDFSIVNNTDFNNGRILGREGDLYDQVYEILDFASGSIVKQFHSNYFLNPYVQYNGQTIYYGLGSKIIVF